jgi:hypothetical protein
LEIGEVEITIIAPDEADGTESVAATFQAYAAVTLKFEGGS